MTPESIPANPPQAPRSGSRRFLILRFCFALFTLEVGLFLLIFPWTDTWLFNFFQDYHALLRNVWEDPYFRGGVSGLGAVNIYLSIIEFLRAMRRT